MNNMFQKLDRYTISLCILIAAIGLAILAYLGFYNRYWADDWCYNTDFKHLGVVRSVGTYFVTGAEAHRGYPPNRYSFAIFSGLLYLPGMFGTQILPTLTILLWLGSLLWTGQNLNRAKPFTGTPILVLAPALLLFYTLYLSPHRFQILYWRSGVLPYSWAIASGLFLLGLITSQLTREQPSKAIAYIIAPVAFIGGGFSEIGSAFLFSGFTLLLLAAWWGKRNSKEWAIKTFSSILMAWIFLLLALVALAVSPSNSRYGDLEKDPNSLFAVPFLSLQYALAYILDSLRTLLLPHFVLFATFVGIGFLSDTARQTNYDFRKSIWFLLLVLLLTILLVAAIQAPTTYLYAAPPDPRGQSLSRFVILTGSSIAAWIVGVIASPYFGRYAKVLAIAVLLVACAYTARAAIIVSRELPGFIERAQLWDSRDAQIKSSIEQGVLQVETTAIDTNEIATRDIIRSRDFGKWVADACGVEYYDAEAMRIAP
jgi:hypothetical protein